MLQTDVLNVLDTHRGNLVAGGELAHDLGVSRNAIWKTINTLRTKGHDIESIPNKGYVLNSESDGLSDDFISRKLNTEKIGRELRVLSSTSSTNLFTQGLPSQEAHDGLVVVADEQTRGRGRLGREFISPAREGIYLSILLKPHLAFDTLQLITLMTAISVSTAIESVWSFSPEVKWVNDVLVDKKKLCGILTEASVSSEMQLVDSVVVGIGINTGTIPEPLRSIATSTQQVAGKKGRRNDLIAAVLNEFEKRYCLLLEGSSGAILEEYKEHLSFVGKKVEVTTPQAVYELTISGIDNTGALVGIDSVGNEIHIRAGEIRLAGDKAHA